MVKSREILRSSHKLRRRKFFQVFSLALLVLVVVIDLITAMSRLDFLRIKKIVFSGDTEVLSTVAESLVSAELQGQYLGLYPRDNIFLYPQSKIKSDILNIRAVAVAEVLAADQILEIKVTKRDKDSLWCDDVSLPFNDETCYYLDSSGYAFERAPNFSGSVLFRFYGGDKHSGYAGRKILSSDDFSKIRLMSRLLEDSLNSTIASSSIIYGASFSPDMKEVDFLVSSEEKSWFINIAIPFDVPTITHKFDTAISSRVLGDELKKNISNLSYIDLRFGNKVFYKFQ